jgi:hypothetical protein
MAVPGGERAEHSRPEQRPKRGGQSCRPFGKSLPGVRLNEHMAHPKAALVFHHACKLGAEGIVSNRLGSHYRSGRSPDWLKFKNPDAPAVKREAEEDWAK